MTHTDPLAARIDALRADTPGTDHVAHLNNAGSALPPAIVTDTVVAHLANQPFTEEFISVRSCSAATRSTPRPSPA